MVEIPYIPGHSGVEFSAEANTKEYARTLDEKDPLRHFREKFVFPTKNSLKCKRLTKVSSSDEPCIYFCGNSLGLQPRAVSRYLEAQLDTWGSLAVNGHFTNLEGSPLQEWQSMAEYAAEMTAGLVGASPSEVAIMNTLTVNLHLLMASFYKPTPKRHKIILDWKAFPSDHVRIPFGATPWGRKTIT
jgi:kynureninase